MTPRVGEVLKRKKIDKLDLISRNETVNLKQMTSIRTNVNIVTSQVEIEARESLYQGTGEKNPKLQLLLIFARKGIPIIFVSFKFVYWSIGLIHVYNAESLSES